MKKIIVMILICAGSLVKMHAQENEKVEVSVTVDNLSMLYRNAQLAESAGDYESAVKGAVSKDVKALFRQGWSFEKPTI
jgi:hypothetical protein